MNKIVYMALAFIGVCSWIIWWVNPSAPGFFIMKMMTRIVNKIKYRSRDKYNGV
jgi:hypothetical protein